MQRSARRASIVLAATFALLAPLTSCATTTGAIVGPVTAPMGFVKYTRGIPEWARWIVAPMTVPLGPVIGLVQGVQCDVGFVKHGAYGVDKSPEFGRVFDPLSTEVGTWDRMHGIR